MPPEQALDFILITLGSCIDWGLPQKIAINRDCIDISSFCNKVAYHF